MSVTAYVARRFSATCCSTKTESAARGEQSRQRNWAITAARSFFGAYSYNIVSAVLKRKGCRIGTCECCWCVDLVIPRLLFAFSPIKGHCRRPYNLLGRSSFELNHSPSTALAFRQYDYSCRHVNHTGRFHSAWLSHYERQSYRQR